MKGMTIIKKDGRVIQEVVDREGEDCKTIHRVIASIGKTVSEEVTGPDCDEVHETNCG